MVGLKLLGLGKCWLAGRMLVDWLGGCECVRSGCIGGGCVEFLVPQRKIDANSCRWPHQMENKNGVLAHTQHMKCDLRLAAANKKLLGACLTTIAPQADA